jgi:hypothetical protein
LTDVEALAQNLLMEKSGTELTTSLQILRVWEKAYHKLNPEEEYKFHTKVKVLGLTLYEEEVLVAAISVNKKLQKVAEVLRKRKKDALLRQAEISAEVQSPRANQSHKNPAGGLSGTAGARSSYSSGMVRNPGLVEMAVGERCSQCGAFVPSGAAHDC